MIIDLNDKKFGDKLFKKPIHCKCGSSEWDEAVEQFKNKSIHIRGTCTKCHKFIQWIPYTESKTIKWFLLKTLEEQND